MTLRSARLVIAVPIVLAVAGCGGRPQPTTVDELRGTYRGVGIGDTVSTVRQVMGDQTLSGTDEPIAPRRESFVDIGGPTVVRFSGPCGRRGRQRTLPSSLRYDHVTFLACRGRVTGFIVAQSGARTRRGVSIGDDANEVRTRYPGLGCGSAPFESGDYPYCAGRLASHRWIWFGRNPIRSITVNSAPLVS